MEHPNTVKPRLYKRGSIWWGWHYDIRGGLHRVSLRTRHRQVAARKLAELERLAGQDAITFHQLMLSIPLGVLQAIPRKATYAIRSVAGGPIKLGRATNVESRLASIQIGHPERLELVVAVRERDVTESQMHQAFAAERIRGEWFSPSPRLLSLLREVSAYRGPGWYRLFGDTYCSCAATSGRCETTPTPEAADE